LKLALAICATFLYTVCALSGSVSQSEFSFLPPAPVVASPSAAHSKPRARSGSLGITVTTADKKEYMRQWRILNAAHRKAYIAAYRIENKEAIREQRKQYVKDNPEKIKEQWDNYWAREKDRMLAEKKAAYDADPEKWRAAARKSHHKHKAERNAQSIAYSRLHEKELREYRSQPHVKENIKQIGDKWRAENPEKVRAIVLRRRARKRSAAGADYTTADLIRGRWLVWDNQCWICGDRATATDHVIPLKHGGCHWPSNLRPICKPCNSVKQARLLPICIPEAAAIIISDRKLICQQTK
jgi:hypothetical protein